MTKVRLFKDLEKMLKSSIRIWRGDGGTGIEGAGSGGGGGGKRG